MKIERLNAEQIARQQEFIERWSQIGLSTDPADRPRAEAAIAKMYEVAGLTPPKIVWCGSPMGNALTRAIVLDKTSAGASVGASVRASVWDSVWDSVGDSVGDSVRASVRASVWDSVGASVEDSVRASVWASVRASVYGQHDANWLGFYDYFREVCGLTAETGKLIGLWELSKSAGWAIPHAAMCWVSERPTAVCRDERGRLHCTDGPALLYPDGWCIYSVHGVRVPACIIEQRGQITPEQIDAEKNAEVRRVMIDLYGPDRYVAAAGTEIHRDEFGILYRKQVAGDEPILMLKVVNSTPEPDGSFKDYWLRVPPTIRTAREASAWTFDMKAQEYRPLVES